MFWHGWIYWTFIEVLVGVEGLKCCRRSWRVQLLNGAGVVLLFSDIHLIYSSVTKVQFVHTYQNLHFWYIISILLKKFNLFNQIEACNFQIFICYKSSICSPISKLAFLKYWSNSILLQKFTLFTHIESYNFQIFISYKSSICSMVSKLAFL